MKSLIVLAALLVPLCLAGTDPHKHAMIKENKTPKEAAPAMNSACDECKLILTRFNEAVKDPAKLAELKMLLNMACEETSYARECKMLVSRLDVIVQELAPYLKDPEAVCKKFHMCGNARLEKIHRLALVYAKKYMNQVDGVNDIVCEECQFAVAELKSVVEDRSSQAEIKAYIHQYICKNLGQYEGTCDELVEQFLPELFEELERFLQNSKQVCTDLGLCAGQNILVNGQPVHPADNTRVDNSVNRAPRINRLKSFYNMLNNLQTQRGIHMTCFECDFAMTSIIGALKTDTVLGPIGTDVQELACDTILPQPYQDGCNDFLSLYLPTVLKLTADQLDAMQICKMLHMCDTRKSQAIKTMSASQKASAACESCKGITDFLRMEINSAGFQSDIEFGLQRYMCTNMPQSVTNLCENLIKTYVPLVLQKVVVMLNSETICKDDLHMCTSELLQQISDQ